MNKYKKYTEYKDSGVEWMDGIPKHWKIKKAKHLFRLETGGTPLTNNDNNFDKKGIPWVKPENLDEFNPILKTKRNVTKTGMVGIPIIPQNSILICGIGTVGKFGISGTDVITNQQINSFIPLKIISTAYSKYLLSSSKEQLELTANKVVVAISNKTAMQNIYLCFPSYKEQKKIAAFLDYETGKIDKLIEKQEELVALLEEKRQAVISHTVTKGLDPSVPMKDSGVDWIKNIPRHWSVTRNKHIFKIKKIIAGKLGYDVLSITQQGIKIKDITSGEGQLSMDYSKYQLVKPGDFGMNHMDLLTGFVDISKYEGVTSPDYRVFSLVASDCDKDYFLYIFQLCYWLEIFFPFGQGSSHLGRWRLPTEQFNLFMFPVPPLGEQKKISTFLKDNIIKMDQLIAKAKSAIELMQERRTALISAAVTGKIDVRDFTLEEHLTKRD